MQYDLNLTANGAQQIDVAGTYFKYAKGIGPIRVQVDGGGYVDLLPGQGMQGMKFTRLMVKDTSGATNTGALVAGEGQFIDARISGTVDVVDGGKARTLSSVAFMGACGVAGAAGQYGHVQLFNPAGSGKNLVLEQMIVSCSVAGQIDFGPQSLQLVSVYGLAPISKKFTTGQPATVGVPRVQTAVSNLLGNAFGNLLVQANQAFVYKFSEPVIIAPGMSMMVQTESLNSTLNATFEYFEDPA